jgi:pimeloyl-ACP methyl ester carboxylesterase
MPFLRFAVRRSLAIAVAATLLAVFGMPATAKTYRTPPVHPALLAPRTPSIQWAPCSGAVSSVQCGRAQVPLDYNSPDGVQIEIALARVPARNPSQKIGSLFLNPGGPGGSGVDLIREGFTAQIDPAVLDRFDIVGWDPRGIGQSTPIQCWATDAARQAYFTNSPVFPYRSDQEQTLFALRTNIFNLCINRSQGILWHMSTANVARDLDLLRQAVGDRQLNYIGYSYGSYIGHTYANMFSMNIRAMVIDGVIDPTLYASGRMIDSNKTSTDIVMQQFFALCEAAGARCPLNGNGGPRLRFKKILDRLLTASITYVDGQGNSIVYTYDSFVDENVAIMQGPESWPDYAAQLATMSNGISGKNGTLRRAPRHAWQEVLPGNFTEAFLGNHCADVEYPSTLAQFSQIGQDAAAHSVQGPVWSWEPAGCASWPASQHRYLGPWKTTTSAPVLIVGNYYDAATDYAGAVASSRLLSNSRLLSYAGWGHTTTYTGRSACVSDHVSLYLIDGSLPPTGTVCPAAQNPFTVSPKARTKTNPALRLLGNPMRSRSMFMRIQRTSMKRSP